MRDRKKSDVEENEMQLELRKKRRFMKRIVEMGELELTVLRKWRAGEN